MSRRFTLFSRISVIVVLTTTVIAAVVWMNSTPRAFDDYIYSTEFSGIHELVVLDSLGLDVNTFPQAIRSAEHHFGSENGRLSNIIDILLVPFGRGIKSVFCGLVTGLLCIMMAWWGRRGRYPSLPGALVAVWLLWCAFPWYDFFQTFSYHANYVWPSVMMLAVMMLVKCHDRIHGWRFAAIAVISFLTGWMHESFCIALGVWLFMDAVCTGQLRNGKLWTVMGCLIAGGLVNIAGGTFVRAADSNALMGISRFGVIAKQLAVQLWPFYLAVAVAAAAAVRGRKHEVITSYVPLLVASVVVIAMSVVLGMIDRVLWPLDLMSALVVIAECNRFTGASRPRLTAAVTVLLYFLYCFWIAELVTWQRRVTADVNRAERILSPRSHGGSAVVFMDYTTADELPFYLMSITLPPFENEWNSECMGSYFRHGRYSFLAALPADEGKPFDEWTPVSGNTSLKGRWPMVATRDTSATKLRVTYSAPDLRRMAPLNVAYLLMARQNLGGVGVADIDVTYHPVVLPDGDTVYRLFPAIPRFFMQRDFIKAETTE